MLYVQRRPDASAASVVESLWYVRRPAPETAWERVLPGGRAQLVINLAHDCCTGRDEDGQVIAQAPALAVGMQHRAMSICTRDTEEMVGLVLTPTGMSRLLREPAHVLCRGGGGAGRGAATCGG